MSPKIVERGPLATFADGATPLHFMKNILKEKDLCVLEDGDAEEADATSKEGSTWYIPNHGVYHARKFEGTSLNDHLFTGPDLTNALTGVLCRFREHRIAITCDVEKMFHCFHVHPEDCDFLRFLWWKNGNTEREPKEYQMRVHIFGAASSPGCANYGMQYLARKYERDYPVAANFIQKNFYVDDGLISIDSAEKAKQLVNEARELLTKGKLRLHKFVSSSEEVLEAIPHSECASVTRDVNLNYNELQMQSVLGVKWNVDTDAFSFNVVLNERIVADEQVHCALVMGKARVAPTNVITIPRLELTAATVSAARIRDTTDPRQWFYVETGQNPADHVSRGLKVADLIDSNWLIGPKFLWETEIVTSQRSPELHVGDPEVKVLKTDAVERESFLERLSRFSDWNTAINIISRIQTLANRDQSGTISVEERTKATFALIRAPQREAFGEELK
ncbi:hypothetical protein SRHO_G00111890 [Serrasalmus rhombeus]